MANIAIAVAARAAATARAVAVVEAVGVASMAVVVTLVVLVDDDFVGEDVDVGTVEQAEGSEETDSLSLASFGLGLVSRVSLEDLLLAVQETVALQRAQLWVFAHALDASSLLHVFKDGVVVVSEASQATFFDDRLAGEDVDVSTVEGTDAVRSW